jgi:hypothetical protein
VSARHLAAELRAGERDLLAAAREGGALDADAVARVLERLGRLRAAHNAGLRPSPRSERLAAHVERLEAQLAAAKRQ